MSARLPADAPPPLPFEDSRRLTGPNLYFAGVGAVLETVGGADAADLDGWRVRVGRMGAALGWPDPVPVVRVHHSGASLAFAAPVDRLFAATEVNEWAWGAQRGVHAMHAPGHAAAWDEASARHTLQAMADAEQAPALLNLLEQAHGRGVPVLLDDDRLTLGFGEGGRSWPLAALPAPDAVPWPELRAVPTALVTGSNGKTTTVRLLAAMLRAHGLRTGHSCTDGVFVDGARLQAGDWSGPAGARSVLRDPRVQAAVLETARGGLLRRGLAVWRADVAVVTNISADHFGEYGIHDLEGLADAKLTVARALGPHGVLVANADDALLAAHAEGRAATMAWFARDHDHPRLRAHRAAGGMTCAVRDGELLLGTGDQAEPIADVATMPLAAGGLAAYNLANAAAAALMARALGVPASTIATVLARFGDDPADNPGRLQRWHFGGLRIVMDYAHNPDGLRGLLDVASSGDGRLGLLLGQAGNRAEPELRALAAVAAAAAPDFVVLKDIDGYLRGRSPGEVAAILGDEVQRRGVPAGHVVTCLPELDAARTLLAWARPGDRLVMPVHSLTARAAVSALFDALKARDWVAGQPFD